MTNLTGLDKAVYNECGPLVCRLIWEDAQHYGLSVLEKRWPVLMRCIRARYRQIVAQADKPQYNQPTRRKTMKKIALVIAALTLASPTYAAELCIRAHSANDTRPAVGSMDKAGATVCIPVTATTLNR